YRGFDTVVIVGRELPRIEHVERDARSLWFDSAHTLTTADNWMRQPRRYRMRDGAARAELVHTHPDPLIDTLLRSIREAEIEQGIDRLRLVHATEPKRVVLLTNTPTDIVV